MKRLIFSLLFLIVHTTYTSAAVKVVECKDAEAIYFSAKLVRQAVKSLMKRKLRQAQKLLKKM